MKWLNCSKIVIVLVGFVAVIVHGDGTAKADFTFGEPALFDEAVNSTGVKYFSCISADGLEVYIDKPVSGDITASNWDIYVSTRETTNDPWPYPVSLGSAINSSNNDGFASLSCDGLELYFASKRPGGHGNWDLWVTTRPTVYDNWSHPVNLGQMINTSDQDMTPWITQDGLELYFSSDRPGGYGVVDIWVATRTTRNDAWGEPVNLGSPVNTSAGDYYPCLSPDGLVLFFSDYDNPNYLYRPGGYGQSDTWMTRRKSTADPWEEPVNLGSGLNTSAFDSYPRISPDGSILYFTSSRPDDTWISKTYIWQAQIEPIVDFNGDGIVDSADLCIMVDHWGTDNSLCDIGPMAWGDGIVDVEDMKILSEHLFEEVDDPTLIAHWPLDEVQGDIAYDGAAENDGTLVGNPVWLLDGGMIGGTIQLDGIDDYVTTDTVLNPGDGVFSVVAWIKGGEPGQVIVSQQAMANWLVIDTEGQLMTELKCTGRSAGYLFSEVVITDGQWHRIGLVWDGSNRILYVDGVVVTEDTQQGLESSQMGLFIGTGKNIESGTFFSGLIDDIRIYNRVVNP